MSEYFLADRKAAERARQRKQEQDLKKRETLGAQDMKVTLLGDFLFPSNEPQGCDPYNSVHGKNLRDAWRLRRGRG
jgi:hypothetical protein